MSFRLSQATGAPRSSGASSFVVPAGAACGAQDRVDRVDLASVHLEHMHVGVAYEQVEADPDAGLDVRENDMGFEDGSGGIARLAAPSQAAIAWRVAVFEALAVA